MIEYNYFKSPNINYSENFIKDNICCYYNISNIEWIPLDIKLFDKNNKIFFIIVDIDQKLFIP